MENEILKFLACLKYRKRLERTRLSIKKTKDNLKHGNWLAVFWFKSQLGEFNVQCLIHKLYVNSFFIFVFFPHSYVRGE